MSSNVRTGVVCLLLAAACQRGVSEDSPGPGPASLRAPRASPCVHYKDLVAFLPPSLQGYAAQGNRASIGKYGEVSVSEAERDYRSPDGDQISIRIVDTTLLGTLGKAIRAAASDAQKLSDEDPVGPVHLPMSVGYVRYEPEDQSAEVNLLVGERYVVAVTSKGAAGTHVVRQAAQRLDLVGLAKLR